MFPAACVGGTVGVLSQLNQDLLPATPLHHRAGCQFCKRFSHCFKRAHRPIHSWGERDDGQQDTTRKPLSVQAVIGIAMEKVPCPPEKQLLPSAEENEVLGAPGRQELQTAIPQRGLAKMLADRIWGVMGLRKVSVLSLVIWEMGGREG